MDEPVRSLFEKVAARSDLTRAEAHRLFEHVMTGQVPDLVLAAILGALRAKGLSVGELVGAAEAMRAHSIKVRSPADAIDTCGTGGDGISTFNVSTTAAIIAAAAGATVAKHGNRSNTRASGSTEFLEAIGIDTEAPTEVVERSLAEARIGYLNARQLHPAMRHAAPVRMALKVRTIFNFLGPLTNPAGVTRQVLGVPRDDMLDLMAGALRELGARHAWVVRGSDGLCDLTITGETTVVEVRGGTPRRFVVTPEDVGLPRGPSEALRVSSAEQSAAVASRILDGETGTPRDHALLNAGAALVVAGVVDGLAMGVERAARAVDDGSARGTLQRWRAIAGRTP
jgi:anthranilate phosphoribosyltransferase